MINNQHNITKNKKDHDSELLLKILNKASIEEEIIDDKELFVDENWKINSKDSKDSKDLLSDEHSNLKKLLSELFPDKKISVKDSQDGSQTILII